MQRKPTARFRQSVRGRGRFDSRLWVVARNDGKLLMALELGDGEPKFHELESDGGLDPRFGLAEACRMNDLPDVPSSRAGAGTLAYRRPVHA